MSVASVCRGVSFYLALTGRGEEVEGGNKDVSVVNGEGEK